jgi:hypothetical protein
MNYTTSGGDTSSIGDHTHSLPSTWYARNFGMFQDPGAYSHAIPGSSTFNTLTAVNGGTRPPWYALYYIMKTN